MHRLNLLRLVWLGVALLLGAERGIAADHHPEETWTEGWQFTREAAEGAQQPGFNASGWQSVIVPHDWSIAGPVEANAPSTGHGGYFPTGIGWYRRTFAAPVAWRGQRVEIEFEGVYRHAEVWLNGVPLGKHANGYTPFRFNLAPHLKFGTDNVLAVRVDNSAQPGARWYTGSGIYRPVHLRVTRPLHVPSEGIVVITRELTAERATVEFQAQLRNDADAAAEAELEIELRSAAGRSVARSRLPVVVAAGADSEVRGVWEIPRPQAWSPESPNLYAAVVRLRAGKQIVQEVRQAVGLRTLAFSAARGFELNGKPVKLFGGNVHHDTGILGAAAFARAETRKVELLKAAGFNAVRTAHNPPSRAFLEACDRIGLLVMDEIYDGWEKSKTREDYGREFAANWRDDIETWVRRDRRHPSVVIWSIGNEMYERGNAGGQRIARELAATIRNIDPTRPVTAGVNGLGKSGDWPKLDPLFAAFDLAGYNYELAAHHAADHARLPERIMFASESYQSEAFANWAIMHDNPGVVGDFVWSAIDYLGEAGIGRIYPSDQVAKKHWEGEMWPWHGAYCGDIDLTGWRKPVSHYRQIVWDRGEKLYAAVLAPTPDGKPWNTTPWSMPTALPSWTWPGQEGRELAVEVYSRYDTVRLELNGRTLGEKATTRAEEFKAVFAVPYAAGELKVVGMNAGRPAETFVLRTAGKTQRFRLTVDRARLHRGGQDLAFVTIEAVDAAGLRQSQDATRLTVDIAGAGSLAALGNGDLTSFDSYLGPHCSLYQGRALAVVRSGAATGGITLTVSAPGFVPARVTLKTVKP